MDYESFMNKQTLARKPTVLRALFDGFGIGKSHILMAGGLPSPELFAIKSAKLQLSDGTEVEMNENDMAMGQQYGDTSGNAELMQWVTDMVRMLHNPPTMQNPDHPGALQIIMTSGAQDGIYKCLECLLDEEDVVLTEEPVYTSFLTMVLPHRCHLLAVKTDHDGIIPEHLEETLLQLKHSKDAKSTGKVKVLYLVANGGNPTGAQYTLPRKQAIYKLASEHNFMIIEDDAYYFLEARPLPPTFLSMDVDGRVLRLDSFSKTVSPGLRIGYMSGPKPIIQKALMISMSSTQGCSPMCQILLLQLLRKWGHNGFIEHCQTVAKFYDKKRAMCTELAEKHLKDLATWHTPTGGMFLWVELMGLDDSYAFVMERLLKRKLLIVGGSAFMRNENEPCPYVRISFSIATWDEMDKAFAIMAEELKEIHKEKSLQNGT